MNIGAIHRWAVRNIPSDSTIIEAGSSDGRDTLRFARDFPEGRVYGFEPVGKLWSTARKKLEAHDNVVLSNKALDYESGTKELHISDRSGRVSGSSSLLPPKDHLWFHEKVTFKTTEMVETVGLDDWIRENNIEKIDFAWLDMQGYEPVLLQNSPLAMSLIECLYTEVSLIETYESVMQYPEYKKMLQLHGFEVVDEDLPWKDMGNVLFRKGDAACAA